jgi:hypothetical protein
MSLIISSIGLSIILILFYSVQTQKLASASLLYSLGNALGAFMMLLAQLGSLQSLTSILIEIIWLVISLVGLRYNKDI